MPDNRYADEEAEYDALEGEVLTLEDEVTIVQPEGRLATEASRTRNKERVQANIASSIPSWRGVRSCNSAERAEAAARPVAQNWVNQTIAANPGREVLQAGYYGAWKYRNETTGSGRRRCKGEWTECIAYVDFSS